MASCWASLRVDGLGGGGEDDEPPDDEPVPVRGAHSRGQSLEVGGQGSRVGVQVLPRGELEGVDEDGDDDDALGSDPAGRLGHQVEMPLVERPHGHDRGAQRPGVVLGEGRGELIAAASQVHPRAHPAGGGRGEAVAANGVGRGRRRHEPTLAPRPTTPRRADALTGGARRA